MKTAFKTTTSDVDSKNRQFIWTAYTDGTAISREITRRPSYEGGSVETWREVHAADSEMAIVIAAM